MSDAAREEILQRVRTALGPAEASEAQVARGYRRAGTTDRDGLVALLERRLDDYGAMVVRVGLDDVANAVERACSERGLRRIAIPAGLDQAWRPEGVELVVDRGLAAGELDALDGALTGCATAIAQTGTLVLDGGERCGRRALTLVVDHHLCVVTREQIVELVPEAVKRLSEAVRDRRAPITFVSGPSASADIEFQRVEGVHGPRHLLVLIAG